MEIYTPSFCVFTEEILKNATLSEVRALARAFGDNSPTTKTVGVLRDFIIKAQSSGVQPKLEKNKYGAPSKFVDLSRYYDENSDIKYPVVTASSNITFSDGDYLVEGTFDQKGPDFGFLRGVDTDTVKGDVYVSLKMITRFGFMQGDIVKGVAKKMRDNAPVSLVEVISINGIAPVAEEERFEKLNPCHPNQRFLLENSKNAISNRIIDIFAPIGKGQRGLIVAPPKSGKTTVLKGIAKAIEDNHPDTLLMVLLIDERPEEVSEFKSYINSTVYSSTFDEDPTNHISVAEGVLRRAKKFVEQGKDVVVLMDSITKLARAYNAVCENSGKTLSGGLDPLAIYEAKKFFGSARNTDAGVSLTIVSTALVETGSRMDDFIYEEFKGTGNMELHLNRALAEKRVFPAIDIFKSGTRKEELLLSEEELSASYKVRKLLANDKNATESLINTIKNTDDNAEFLLKIDKWIDIYKG